MGENIKNSNFNDLYDKSNKTSSNSIHEMEKIYKFKSKNPEKKQDYGKNIEICKNLDGQTILKLKENNLNYIKNQEESPNISNKKKPKKSVKFIDQLNLNKKYSLFEKRDYLVEIIDIESYKEYNKIDERVKLGKKIKEFFKKNSCGIGETGICIIF